MLILTVLVADAQKASKLLIINVVTLVLNNKKPARVRFKERRGGLSMGVETFENADPRFEGPTLSG